jgi:hypothetical protein
VAQTTEGWPWSCWSRYFISASGVPATDALAAAVPRAPAAAPVAVALRLDELAAPRPNRAPVADAGADLAVAERDGGQLNGAASFDPDGDELAFQWVQVAGAPVVLEPSARVPNPAFAAPLAGGALLFELRVTDIHGLRAADRVAVTIVPAGQLPREQRAPMRGEVSLARR